MDLMSLEDLEDVDAARGLLTFWRILADCEGLWRISKVSNAF